MTTAAATLRALADAAPQGLHVAEDAYGDLDLFDGDDRLLQTSEAGKAALALARPLLAALPALIDHLEEHPTQSQTCTGCILARAIEAGAR